MEDNVGDGRVSGEYDNWVGRGWDWNQMLDDEAQSSSFSRRLTHGMRLLINGELFFQESPFN